VLCSNARKSGASLIATAIRAGSPVNIYGEYILMSDIASIASLWHVNFKDSPALT
jgi:hypothetical protein